MAGNKKEFKQWIKEHKKELIIAGIGITSTIGIVVGVKNNEDIFWIWKSHKKCIEDNHVYRRLEDIQENFPTKYTREIYVPQYIRKLPQGSNASPVKIAEAIEENIPLKDNQTLVKSYIYNKEVIA